MTSRGRRRYNDAEMLDEDEKRFAKRVYNRLRKGVGGLDPSMSSGCRHDLNFR